MYAVIFIRTYIGVYMQPQLNPVVKDSITWDQCIVLDYLQFGSVIKFLQIMNAWCFCTSKVMYAGWHNQLRPTLNSRSGYTQCLIKPHVL